jgi:hypothetical protein
LSLRIVVVAGPEFDHSCVAKTEWVEWTRDGVAMKVAAKAASRKASKIASRKGLKVTGQKSSIVASRKALKVTSRKAPKVTSRRASKIMGTTSDGVRILKPKARATHFTANELEAAISRALAARSLE